MSYKRQDAGKQKRIGTKYRKPKGLQSKMRLRRKGYPSRPSSGQRTERSLRGLHDGQLPVVVRTVAELTGLKACPIIISAKLGDRKRTMILEKAKEQSLTIINLDAERTLARIAEARKKRAAKPAKRPAKGIEQKVEQADSAKDDAPSDKAVDEEQQKRKVLTKKV